MNEQTELDVNVLFFALGGQEQAGDYREEETWTRG
jgi:hypothetical protein